VSIPPSTRQSTVKPRRGLQAAPQGLLGRHVVRLVFGVLIGLALVDGLFGQRGLLENRQLRAVTRQMEASVETLQEENARLREESRLLKEDPSIVEELARRDMGLMKDGELVVILKDVTAPSPSLQSPEAKKRAAKKQGTR
jgi:cell division protein FtsB